MTMELNPVDLYYEEYGQGIPVVFLHGYPLDHSIWLPVSRLLADKGRIILPDLRGYGQSPDGDSPHSIRIYVEDIVKLLDRLGLEKVVLIGHSMGGYTALLFARAYPHRLAGLGLIATQAEVDTPEKRQMRLLTARKVLKRGIQSVANGMAPKLTKNVLLQKQLVELMEKTKPEIASASLHAMAERQDATPWLPGIKIPTMVIAGGEDQLIPKANSDTLVKLLAKSWMVELPTAGHMPMLEEPEETARAVEQLICQASGC